MSSLIKWSNDPKLNKIINDAWLDVDLPDDAIFNPLDEIPEELTEKPEIYLTWLMSQPEYLSIICSEILNIQLLPQQALIINELWNRRFPMLIGTRGLGKSFLMAIYCMLRILLLPGRKVVVAGAAYRQSRFIFEYMQGIYSNAPLLRDIIGNNGGDYRDIDMCRFEIGTSKCCFIPLGDGQKIRGLRANDIVTDEFSSVPRDIFETVLSGFAAVKANPIESVKLAASIRKAKELGIDIDDKINEYSGQTANQIIISGTCDYDFQHFASYWKRWRAIINSKGDMSKLTGVVTEEYDKLDHKDYSIIRIPYELAPTGFMDEAIIARAKATMVSGTYQREYAACFSKDSMGYFRRSLIEQCSITKDTDWATMPAGASLFQASLSGDNRKTYVFAIDPASEVDNFSIVVLELHESHRRIVYCWVTNAKEHAERIKKKLSNENDYYSYCCRKIRDLMKVFPCERLVIDGQGGGKAIIEGLHDKDKMEPGEQQLWHVIDPDERRDSDGYSGQHIIIEVKFANADWATYANTGLRKDFEDKVLLFPFFDPVTLSLSSIEDEKNNRLYDTLEDCVVNIEQLKEELATIVMTTTPNGRDRWDTPEYKLPGGKKGRMRKDRYSALLMANAVARQLQRIIKKPVYISEGGFAEITLERPTGPDYVGPAWFTEKMRDVY